MASPVSVREKARSAGAGGRKSREGYSPPNNKKAVFLISAQTLFSPY
jgi:hypothetical protein